MPFQIWTLIYKTIRHNVVDILALPKQIREAVGLEEIVIHRFNWTTTTQPVLQQEEYCDIV